MRMPGKLFKEGLYKQTSFIQDEKRLELLNNISDITEVNAKVSKTQWWLANAFTALYLK